MRDGGEVHFAKRCSVRWKNFLIDFSIRSIGVKIIRRPNSEQMDMRTVGLAHAHASLDAALGE